MFHGSFIALITPFIEQWLNCESSLAERNSRAESIRIRLRRLFDILMIETNPIPVKWALFEMNLLGPHIRLPMTRLGKEFQEQVRRCLQELELIPA